MAIRGQRRAVVARLAGKDAAGPAERLPQRRAAVGVHIVDVVQQELLVAFGVQVVHQPHFL